MTRGHNIQKVAVVAHAEGRPADTVRMDPASLGSAVLLLAECGRAGIRVKLTEQDVFVEAAAECLSGSLADRLPEQQPALLEVGRAVITARDAIKYGSSARRSIADELDDDCPIPF